MKRGRGLKAFELEIEIRWLIFEEGTEDEVLEMR